MPVDSITFEIAGLSSSRLRPASRVCASVVMPASFTCLSNIARTARSRRRSATRLSLAAMNCRKFCSVSLYSDASLTLFASAGVICAVPPAIGVAALLSPVSTVAAAPTLPAAESVVEFSDRPHATIVALSASAATHRRAITTFTSRMLSPMKRSTVAARTRRAPHDRDGVRNAAPRVRTAASAAHSLERA